MDLRRRQTPSKIKKRIGKKLLRITRKTNDNNNNNININNNRRLYERKAVPLFRV